MLAKISNLYVKFDAKLKKGGHWVETKEKREDIGRKISRKNGVY